MVESYTEKALPQTKLIDTIVNKVTWFLIKNVPGHTPISRPLCWNQRWFLVQGISLIQILNLNHLWELRFQEKICTVFFSIKIMHEKKMSPCGSLDIPFLLKWVLSQQLTHLETTLTNISIDLFFCFIVLYQFFSNYLNVPSITDSELDFDFTAHHL